MCFGNSLKGDNPASNINGDSQDYNTRPVDSKKVRPQSSGASVKMPTNETYAPPPGPPPPQHGYAPPPGPPPNHKDEYAPPAGPPPTQHNWQAAVPDTSLLPPPPTLGHERSSANNATEPQAIRGEQWCKAHPLVGPTQLSPDHLTALSIGNIILSKPKEYIGDLKHVSNGHWHGKTKARNDDNALISTLPLYSVQTHSPLSTRSSKTIYFEVRISPRNRPEVSLGVGFVAQPYPSFRLPGWDRASLGIHGDDGHKYVNDRWGGKDFTEAFRPGQTLGIGMTFSARDMDKPPAYDEGPAQTTDTSPINVEVFFTRDGQNAGGWNLHEELDANEDLPVFGLEGMHDLYASVGTFEDVEFDVIFAENELLYRP